MGASKKLFNDMRESEEYPPFDHHKRFCEKVKENWLTDEDFRRLKSANLIDLTKAITDKKMDSEYLDELMKLIDNKEPKYLKDSEYFRIIPDTPIRNMQRIYKKYDGINYLIQTRCKNFLEFSIGEKKRKLSNNQ